MDSFCDTPLWNSSVTWNTNTPDFTPCFQNTVLVWVPSAVLLLFTPIEIKRIQASKARPCPWTFVNAVCMVLNISLILLVTLQWGMSSCSRFSPEGLTRADLYAPPVRLITIALVVGLATFARKKGQSTSLVLPLYWLVETLSAALRLHSDVLSFEESTDPMKKAKFVIGCLYMSFVVLQLLLFGGFHSSKPDPTDTDDCPIKRATFFSRIFFAWMFGVFYRGLRGRLTTDNLLPMCGLLKCSKVTEDFEKASKLKQERWVRSYSTSDVEPGERTSLLELRENWRRSRPFLRRRKLLTVLVKTGGRHFFIGSVLQFLSVAVGFATPFALNFLLNFMKDNEEPYWHGFVYAFVFYIGAMFCRVGDAHYQHFMSATAVQVKSSLISAVYKKLFRLSSAAKREHTSGEIINLMAIDTENIFQFTLFASHLWAIPLRIGVSVYVLWLFIGPSCLVGMAIIVVMSPLTAFVARKCDNLQLQRMAKRDERLKIINEILNGIKVLKLYAWEKPFMDRVQEARSKELSFLNKCNWWSLCFNFLWMTAPFMVALGSFTSFVLADERNVLDPSSAFVSLTVFGMLRFPMGALPNVLGRLVRAKVSLERLDKFLSSEELNTDSIGHNPPADCAVSFKNGTFSWNSGQKPTLKNLTLHIKKGSLVAVVGSVGSGKTSLFSAVLGEMKKLAGDVHINGSVALVSQQAWIQNATLKNNVLFTTDMKNSKYNQILEACALNPDLDMLPGADNTEIGEKGINLSGGQKQRVSLARAVYQDRDIYLLDDSLSAVDAHVATHLFQNVIGPSGLLANKTRVLLTHNITVLPEVDRIIVLENGRVVDQGTYSELTSKGRTFAEYIQQSSESDADSKDKVEISYRKSRQWDVVNLSRQGSVESLVEPDFHRLMEEERVEIGEVSWKVYVQYFKTSGIYLFILTSLCALLYCVCEMGAGVWLSEWSMDQTSQTGKPDTEKRDLRITVFAFLTFGQGATAVLTAWFLYIGGMRASIFLHKRLLDRLLKAPLSFFDTTPMGRILNRFSRDIEAIDAEIPVYLNYCLTMFFWIPVAFITLSLASAYLWFAFVPLIVLYYIVQRLYVATTRQLRRLTSVTGSYVYSSFSESLAGISSIRAFKVEDHFIENCQEKVDNHLNSYFLETAANRWMETSLYILSGVVILSTALLAVIGRDSVNNGLAGLALTYSLEITDCFRWTVTNISQLQTSVVALERVEEYSEIAEEEKWFLTDTIPPPYWPETGDIKIWELSTTYRQGLEPVLKGLTIHIRPGEKVGIVGRTGAGKSSLALSLFRIAEIVDGSIFIDGQDISRMCLYDLRSRLAVIPQDPVVFAGSLRMNLDPWNDYSDKEIWTALELAHLHNFVSSLHGGLLYDIAEGGANLSTGQRQLVCLARALLRKSKILVLDEATASVDMETDQLIQNTIREAFVQCTLITIAHRLHTILDYDRVVVMSNGEIIEDDTPDHLLRDPSSHFHSMAKDAGLIPNSFTSLLHIDLGDILSE